MRYTPTLDRCGITFSFSVPDHAVNIIDACLSTLESMVDWGEYNGKKRNPCMGQPILLSGQPIGQYHCDGCGDMVVAGMVHPEPDPDYERVMGREWPAGYKESE